ncbi:MAG: diacylglycerol kinase family protein [Acutalibacteraceae bacterium]|nr:diacylglycerol kinase family protein [Acutalibacteraceae bacterium]
MSFLKGFFYAFRGIVDCVCDERNMRIHMIAAMYVLYFSQFYNLSVTKLSILLVVIALVMALELVNTAVERVCNAITTEKSRLIRIAKDTSAGAVLVSATVSVFIGVLIFGDTDVIWGIISFLCNTPEYLAVFIISMLFSILFIIIGPRGIVDNIKNAVELRRELKKEDEEISENINKKEDKVTK